MRNARPVLGVAVAGALACATTLKPLAPLSGASPEPASPPRAAAAPGPAATPAAVGALTASKSDARDVRVRVVVGAALDEARFSSRSDWTIGYTGANRVVTTARGGDVWLVRSDGSRLRLQSEGGTPHSPRADTVVLRPVLAADAVMFGGRRFRGELLVAPTDTGLLVLNRLGVEDYLRGVVPLEIGNRPRAEQAAAEAQAIAARSYVYTRIRFRRSAPYDILATTSEQVYGGVEAERPTTDAAIDATAGLGLFHRGELIDAPYHSTCGGSTAAVTEVWQGNANRPYLVAVSDRIPASDRFYCDGSATFRWTRTLERNDLNSVVARYLRTYVRAAPASPGPVREMISGARTPSGRMSSLTLATAGGRYVLRGNDMRFVFRAPGGAILPSTWFSLAASRGSDGTVNRVVFTGRGNGHGVGMCQWGAIGRSRAGHSARDILAAYYPGTVVAVVDRVNLRTPR